MNRRTLLKAGVVAALSPWSLVKAAWTKPSDLPHYWWRWHDGQWWGALKFEYPLRPPKSTPGWYNNVWMREPTVRIWEKIFESINESMRKIDPVFAHQKNRAERWADYEKALEGIPPEKGKAFTSEVKYPWQR